MSSDTLIGLAFHPGPWNVVLPSPADLHSLGPHWIRYLPTSPFQDPETGQNTELDLVVESCRELGIQVLVLVNNETLAENPPSAGSAQWGDIDSGYISRMADLAQKIASFYRGRLGAIELLNEPDSNGVSPEDYAALLRACYRKIKAVSRVPVISAGICCGKNHPYLRGVIQNASGAFDGVGWHPYGLKVEGYPAGAWGYGDLRDSIVRARAIAGKPLWLTELGAALDYNWPTGSPPEEAVAEYLRCAFALLRELGPDTVAHAFWFTWKDLKGGWGLVDSAGIRRLAWYAFQQQTHPAPPEITEVSLTPSTLDSGQLLNISITVRNHSADTLVTQGPEPGFVYEEGDSFDSRGMPPVPQAFRVGIDFDERTGIDHPYRWGLGAPLAPGESTTITGAIKLRSAQTQNYWAGLVQETAGWVQDRQGVQNVTVKPGLQMTSVTIGPSSLNAGDLLQVSLTVVNNGSSTFFTQEPAPGFVYEEGDTFHTRGFADQSGRLRVGIDFDTRAGVDHPYRWGLGAPLPPGESRVITGAIRMKHAQAQNYWAGLVCEQVVWVQDREGRQSVTVVGPVDVPPDIIGVAISPSTLAPGELLNVSIMVKNNSKSPLPTQGPEPGTVYEEGDTFYAHGFPGIPGAFRVGINFDGRTGIDYPYRWGFGTPLAPDESRIITGAIRLRTVRSIKYWAGLVHEQVAWLQDHQGPQTIQVIASST
ncbi:MAG TPA: hypothetical protein VF932_06290 [Anaerolineae bacterium]